MEMRERRGLKLSHFKDHTLFGKLQSDKAGFLNSGNGYWMVKTTTWVEKWFCEEESLVAGRSGLNPEHVTRRLGTVISVTPVGPNNCEVLTIRRLSGIAGCQAQWKSHLCGTGRRKVMEQDTLPPSVTSTWTYTGIGTHVRVHTHTHTHNYYKNKCIRGPSLGGTSPHGVDRSISAVLITGAEDGIQKVEGMMSHILLSLPNATQWQSLPKCQKHAKTIVGMFGCVPQSHVLLAQCPVVSNGRWCETCKSWGLGRPLYHWSVSTED